MSAAAERRGPSPLAGVGLALASVLVTLVVLEIAARLYLVHLASEPRFLSYASYAQLLDRYGSETEQGAALKQLYSPHRYLGFYPTPSYVWGKNRHNSLGYRGEEFPIEKPSGEFRVVCLGGSTTYTSDVEDPALAYPAQLEEALRERGANDVRVINGGAASWTSWESLINFEFRVLDLDPDLIIVYHAINDAHARFVWPPEAYRGDNSGWRAPNQSGLFMPSILEYSTLARIFLIRLGWTGAHADLARTVDRAAPTYYADVFREQIRSGRYPESPFDAVPAERMLEANDPRFFRRNLENIVAIARQHGVGIVLASFAYAPAFDDEPRVSTREYARALREHNEVIRSVSESGRVAYYDFAAEFPTDEGLFTDGRHVNEKGARVKGRLFADFLVDNGLVPLT
ncbi:MAG: SGNH/GDSL hydrolase family protein [Myxococcales bacterium]|nr:MAG: SGNH/GDSL hydrolase family protein [Myxococcales bacterium]